MFDNIFRINENLKKAHKDTWTHSSAIDNQAALEKLVRENEIRTGLAKKLEETQNDGAKADNILKICLNRCYERTVHHIDSS